MAAASGCGHATVAILGGVRFAVHILCGRWFMLFASTMIMSMTGGAYIFGAYSKTLKASLAYDQDTLNTISFSKNIGMSLGIVSGLINEVTPPWVVLLAGTAMNLAGYLMVYLSISKPAAAAHPPVWLMCFYIFLGALSQTFASTGALVTSVKNFPRDRGIVLGMLLGYAGFSGAIYTQLYRAFDGGQQDGASVLLILAWLPTVVSLLFSFTVRVIPRSSSTAAMGLGQERKGMLGFLGVSVLIGIYLLVLNIIEVKVSRVPRHVYHITNTLLLFILVVGPLIIVVKQEYHQTYILQQPPQATTPSCSASPSPCLHLQQDETVCPQAMGQQEVNYSILQALCSKHMLLLFVTTACGIGGIMTVVDNLSQIGQSLGQSSQRTISMLVSLVSLSNYAGRVLAGLGSDYVVECYKLPRPLVLTVTLLVAFFGHLLIAFGLGDALYAASVIAGFCLGSIWTVLFAVVSEVFGLKHFSTLYNLSTLASPVGSYVLSVQVAGRMYDREAQRQGHRRLRKQDLACVGVQCFRASFEIIAGVTLLGMVVSLVMTWRTRAFYRARFSAGGAAVTAVTTDKNIRQDEGSLADKNKTIATSQSLSIC